jgi:NADPH:quinone reductase-like Zn-dependent oxidoreductase
VHTEADFEDSTMKLTNKQGVSVVYNGVGGSMFEKNVSMLRHRGHLVSFGLANGKPVLWMSAEYPASQAPEIAGRFLLQQLNT